MSIIMMIMVMMMVMIILLTTCTFPRKDHLIMNYTHKIDRLPIGEQEEVFSILSMTIKIITTIITATTITTTTTNVILVVLSNADHHILQPGRSVVLQPL